MEPVEFIIKEGDEKLTSHSGLALIGALLNRTGLAQRVDSIVLPGCEEPKISHSDILKSFLGLLCMAKPDYDAIEEFREIHFSRRVWVSPAVRPALLSDRGSMLSVDFPLGRSLPGSVTVP